jgi:hypothetical protein
MICILFNIQSRYNRSCANVQMRLPLHGQRMWQKGVEGRTTTTTEVDRTIKLPANIEGCAWFIDIIGVWHAKASTSFRTTKSEGSPSVILKR